MRPASPRRSASTQRKRRLPLRNGGQPRIRPEDGELRFGIDAGHVLVVALLRALQVVEGAFDVAALRMCSMCSATEGRPLSNFDLAREAQHGDVVVRRVAGVTPNAQGKIAFSFVPGRGYATVTGIEVMPQ